MINTSQRTSWGIVAVVLAVLSAGMASASGPPFGYECFTVKDTIAKAQPVGVATTFLPGFAGSGSDNCTVKVPPKLLCLPSAPFLVPGPGPFAGQGEYLPQLCYKAKCTLEVSAGLAVSDQAGAHSLTPTKAKLLCIPACLVSGAGVTCVTNEQCCSGTCTGGVCS